MTIADFIKELQQLDPSTELMCDGFETPTVEWATIYDFRIVRDDYLGPDESTAKRVVVITGAGDERPEVVSSGSVPYRHRQPYFIKYDYDSVVRS